jgi:membrane protein DedA with SNARE-associated domain
VLERLAGLPFGGLVAALFAIVVCRAQATYWLARGARRGAAATRWGRWVDGPGVARASRVLARWGPPAVTLSFLTVGLQTVMNAAAGASRMRWPVYLVAMLPGCAAWALIYATVGFAVLWAVVGSVAGSPSGVVGLVLLGVVAAVVVTVLVVRRRSAREG